MANFVHKGTSRYFAELKEIQVTSKELNGNKGQKVLSVNERTRWQMVVYVGNS